MNFTIQQQNFTKHLIGFRHYASYGLKSKLDGLRYSLCLQRVQHLEEEGDMDTVTKLSERNDTQIPGSQL